MLFPLFGIFKNGIVEKIADFELNKNLVKILEKSEEKKKIILEGDKLWSFTHKIEKAINNKLEELLLPKTYYFYKSIEKLENGKYKREYFNREDLNIDQFEKGIYVEFYEKLNKDNKLNIYNKSEKIGQIYINDDELKCIYGHKNIKNFKGIILDKINNFLESQKLLLVDYFHCTDSSKSLFMINKYDYHYLLNGIYLYYPKIDNHSNSYIEYIDSVEVPTKSTLEVDLKINGDNEGFILEIEKLNQESKSVILNYTDAKGIFYMLKKHFARENLNDIDDFSDD